MQNNDAFDGSLSQKAMFFINYKPWKRNFSQKTSLFVSSMNDEKLKDKN